jgi:hypothetical protein
MDDFEWLAPKSRFENYVNNSGKSETFIDHFYDKLLHLVYSGDNSYLQRKTTKRLTLMQNFLIDFSRRGQDALNEIVSKFPVVA